MGLNLTKTVADFLKQSPGQKFTAREIAEWILENRPAECAEKRIRSKAMANPLDSDAAVIQQIAAEIGAQRLRMEKIGIKMTEGRPRQYYFTESSDSDEIKQAERLESSAADIPGSRPFTEAKLYPMLAEVLWSEFGIHSKRIDEKRSRQSRGPRGNKWLYPDLVGMENLSKDWHQEIKDCVQQYSDRKTKLWSFEVKILINRSNVREAFFQAVSNSSWANLGYLVASEIEGADTLKELRMLSSLHGIGFISLAVDNLSESQIMIPAKERSDIDWNTANRLAGENKDFLEYIKCIRKFYQTGDVSSSDWDATPSE